MTPATKQFRKRNAILAYLRSTDVHPSADMVYAHLKPEIPDLSLGTVYRNLSMFRPQGTVGSVGTVNGVERFDGNTVPHGHFICTGCGRVLDLEGVTLPQEALDAAKTCSGGSIEGFQLQFTGLCAACRQKLN